jgi:hypothetical protein
MRERAYLAPLKMMGCRDAVARLRAHGRETRRQPCNAVDDLGIGSNSILQHGRRASRVMSSRLLKAHCQSHVALPCPKAAANN